MRFLAELLRVSPALQTLVLDGNDLGAEAALLVAALPDAAPSLSALSMVNCSIPARVGPPMRDVIARLRDGGREPVITLSGNALDA